MCRNYGLLEHVRTITADLYYHPFVRAKPLTQRRPCFVFSGIKKVLSISVYRNRKYHYCRRLLSSIYSRNDLSKEFHILCFRGIKKASSITGHWKMEEPSLQTFFAIHFFAQRKHNVGSVLLDKKERFYYSASQSKGELCVQKPKKRSLNFRFRSN